MSAPSEMDSRTRRIFELKNAGKTHAEIAKVLRLDGITNTKGGQFTTGSVQQWILRWNRKHTTTQTSETSEPSDTTPDEVPSEPSETSDSAQSSDASESSDVSAHPGEVSEPSDTSEMSVLPSEPSDISDDRDMPESWKRQILQMIQTEMRRMMELPTVQKLPTGATMPLPPPVKRVKREETSRMVNPAERVKLGVTLNPRLYELFEEQRAQLGLTASAYLDAVLWNFFGQPDLSSDPSDISDI